MKKDSSDICRSTEADPKDPASKPSFVKRQSPPSAEKEEGNRRGEADVHATEKQKVEEAVRQGEMRYRALFETTLDGIMVGR